MVTRCGLLLAIVLLVASEVHAETYNAKNCSRSEVQSKVNQAKRDGDIVNIPACPPTTWKGTLRLNRKSITIQGQGFGVTTIVDGNEPPCEQCPGKEALIEWHTKAEGFPRLTGLTLDGGPGTEAGASTYSGMLQFTGDNHNIRVDHVRCLQRRHACFRANENVLGVFDHNVIEFFGGFKIAISIHLQSYQGIGAYGDNSWAQPGGFGAKEAFFIEDNSFVNDSGKGFCFVTDASDGARYVIRRNTISNCSFGNHGLETGGRPRSTRSYEYYQNTHTFTIKGCCSPFSSRGGSGLVWDNVGTMSGEGFFNHIFDFATFRSFDAHLERGYFIWGPCGARAIESITRSGRTATVTVHEPPHRVHADGSWVTIGGATPAAYNGTWWAFAADGAGGQTTFTFGVRGSPGPGSGGAVRGAFDGNADSDGYRCIDQSGAGQGALLTGDVPDPTPLNQALDPLYIWNNMREGVLAPGISTGAAVHVHARDYYNGTGSTSVVEGVGRGVVASRPAQCTSGVAYWATDEGEWDSTNGATPDGRLYKCTVTNTWTVFYTPYTYPHPSVTRE